MTGDLAKVARGSVWLALQRILMVLLSLFVTAVVARSLGTDEYGLLAIFLSYGALLGQLSNCGLRPYCVREIAALPQHSSRVVSEMLILRISLAAVVATGTLVWFSAAGSVLEPTLAFALAAQIVTGALATTLVDGLYGVEDLKSVAAAMGSSALVVQFGSLLSALVGWGAIGVAWTYVLGNLVISMLAHRWFMRHAQNWEWRGIAWSTLGHVVRSRTFFAQSLLLSVRRRLDVVLIGHFLGQQQAGAYHSAMALVDRFDLVQDSLSTAVFPRVASLYEHARGQLHGLVRGLVKIFLVISLPFAVAMQLLAADAIRIVFGEGFVAAGPILEVLAISVPFMFISGLFYTVFSAMKREALVLRYVLFSTIAAVAMSLIGIRLAGMSGAAWAFTFSVALLALSFAIRYVSELGSVLSVSDLLLIVGANLAAMGTIWLLRDTHIACKILAFVAAYFMALIAFRVVSLRDIRKLLSSKQAGDVR